MTVFPKSDDFYMQEAYKQALLAYSKDEIPVGAIVVVKNKIIGKGFNQVETLKDATAHAEMIAITSAENFIGSKYLSDCTLYVTLEPCVMCAGALAWTQIGRLVFGAADIQKGYRSYSSKILHPKTQIISGVLEEKCQNILLDFIKKMRS